jgi:Fic family protein
MVTKLQTIKDKAKQWGISERRVRKLCEEGRITGATKIGWIWGIPENSSQPMDKRLTSNLPKFDLTLKWKSNTFPLIDQKKLRLDSLRPIPKQTLISLREKMILEWTYHTNAIEGNTLTLSETKIVLEGITVGGKSMREHLEAINHKEAILYLETLVQDKVALTEWDIKNLHQLVLKNIDPSHAGTYRHENVVISGASHIPPPHYLLKEQMEKFICRYTEWQDFHPIIRATLVHGEFVKIHPFIDGNGRTARLLMNFELMKAGYPPAIIDISQRLNYYLALDKAHTKGQYNELIDLVAKSVIKSLYFWLHLLEGSI